MKRFARILMLCCLTAALLAGTARADFGPKPQLTVKVENGPEEPYYLDLLAEGALSGGWIGPSWDVEQAMERGEIDPELLEALCEADCQDFVRTAASAGAKPAMGKSQFEQRLSPSVFQWCASAEASTPDGPQHPAGQAVS